MGVTVVRLYISNNIANTMSFYKAGQFSPMFKAEMYMYVYMYWYWKSDHRCKGCIRKDGSLYVLIR